MMQAPPLCAISLWHSSLGFPSTFPVTKILCKPGWQHSGVSQAHWYPWNWMLLCTKSTFCCTVPSTSHVWIILFCSCFLHSASLCCSRAFCSYLKKSTSSFLLMLCSSSVVFKSCKSWIWILTHWSLPLGCPCLLSGAPVSINSVSVHK